MRDFQLQTPQRDQNSTNRRIKTVDLKKNLQKTAKRSLNPALKADSEDDSTVLEPLKEFSQVSDDNPFGESAENFLASVHPAEILSLESVAVSDLTSTLSPSSVNDTPYKHVANNKVLEVGMLKMAESVEAEMVMKLLREVRIQALKSTDVSRPSKKVMEALINITIEDFQGGLYKEDEWLDKLLSKRYNLVFLICIMWVFSLLMFWSLHWSLTESFTGPPPT